MDKIEATKKASEGYAAYYGDVRRQLTGEYAADGRWMLASLFAVNTGGLVGLSQVDKHSALTAVSLFAFWLGIALALWLAIYSQERTRKFNQAVAMLEQHYVLGAATGQIDAKEAVKLEAAKNEVSTRLAPYLSGGSFVAFSLGLFMVAVAAA